VRIGRTLYENEDDADNRGPAAFRDPPEEAERERRAVVLNPMDFWEIQKSAMNSVGDLERIWSDVSAEIIEMDQGQSVFQLSWRIEGGGDSSSSRRVTITRIMDVETGLFLNETLTTDDRQLLQERAWSYRRLGDTFVPESYSQTVYDSGVPRLVTNHREFTLKDCTLNEPIDKKFVFSHRSLGLQEGERLIDNIEMAEYVYKNEELVRSTGRARMSEVTELILDNLTLDVDATVDGPPIEYQVQHTESLENDEPDPSTAAEARGELNAWRRVVIGGSLTILALSLLFILNRSNSKRRNQQ
jgi:hypothetical protein